MPKAAKQGWAAGVNAAFPVASPGQFNSSHGMMYISSAVETVVAAQDTPVKALGTTTSGELTDFTHSNNRLVYQASKTTHFFVGVSLSVLAAGNNIASTVMIAKNGTVDARSSINRFISTGADEGAVACSALVELAEDDYVELWVENRTNTTNLTISKMVFSVLEVG